MPNALDRRCVSCPRGRQAGRPVLLLAATVLFTGTLFAQRPELGQLDAVLMAIPDLLVPGGRAAIISFHSLEDRRVKWAFKSNPRLIVLTKKPMTATAQEVAVNPRARSAKLRVVERCPNPS